MSDLSKLPLAPWTVHEVYSHLTEFWEIRDANGNYVSTVRCDSKEIAEAICAMRNALDVQMRRGWGVVQFADGRWAIANNANGAIDALCARISLSADPVTALNAADELMKANAKKVQLPPGLQPMKLTDEEADAIRKLMDDPSEPKYEGKDLPAADASLLKMKVVSKPGAAIECKMGEIPPAIQAAITRGLEAGKREHHAGAVNYEAEQLRELLQSAAHYSISYDYGTCTAPGGDSGLSDDVPFQADTKVTIYAKTVK